jgi:hypothetical protein
MTQLFQDLDFVAERLSQRQHELSIRYWKEEQRVRGLRKALISVTEHISHLRSLLGCVGQQSYWAGEVQVRMHKGLIFEVWKTFHMEINGNRIILSPENGNETKRKRIVAVQDLQRVVLIKTADVNKLDKSLLLEYNVPNAKKVHQNQSSALDQGGDKQKTQPLQLRFLEAKKSKFATADHLAHVLKLLNDKVEIRCEIDGSRRVEYALGGTPRKGAQSQSASTPTATPTPVATTTSSATIMKRERRIIMRRATFDGFSSPSEDLWDRGLKTMRRRSFSKSYGSGHTSAESMSSLSSLPLRTSIIKEHTCRHSIQSLSAADRSPSPIPQPSYPHLSPSCVQDINFLPTLRRMLTESVETRDRIQRE